MRGTWRWRRHCPEAGAGDLGTRGLGIRTQRQVLGCQEAHTARDSTKVSRVSRLLGFGEGSTRQQRPWHWAGHEVWRSSAWVEGAGAGTHQEGVGCSCYELPRDEGDHRLQGQGWERGRRHWPRSRARPLPKRPSPCAHRDRDRLFTHGERRLGPRSPGGLSGQVSETPSGQKGRVRGEEPSPGSPRLLQRGPRGPPRTTGAKHMTSPASPVATLGRYSGAGTREGSSQMAACILRGAPWKGKWNTENNPNWEGAPQSFAGRCPRPVATPPTPSGHRAPRPWTPGGHPCPSEAGAGPRLQADLSPVPSPHRGPGGAHTCSCPRQACSVPLSLGTAPPTAASASRVSP